MSVEIVKAKPQAPSKFLVIGEPFSGKTTLAAKSPKPIFISTDGNAAKAGHAGINVKSSQDVRDALKLALDSKAYETIVIDTIEGIADLFTPEAITSYNIANHSNYTEAEKIPYYGANKFLNKILERFFTALASINKNVIVLSYTKRSLDEATNTFQLTSELKQINKLTKFMDAYIITTFDGEKYEARLISKRETIGEVEYGSIEPFLQASGWTLSKKSVKIRKNK